jgi:hypothetical protein
MRRNRNSRVRPRVVLGGRRRRFNQKLTPPVKRKAGNKMINLRNAGTKIAAAMIGTGLAASAAFAGLNGNTVNVTLSDPVVVGSTTLPSGDYTVSEVQLGAESVFVFRNDNGEAAAVATATRSARHRPSGTTTVPAKRPK